MNYSESKDQSAELLRAVLGTMGRHDAAYNPITFAVWYEYLAGINPGLVHAMDECMASEPRLGDATMKRMFASHIAVVDSTLMERISGDFKRVMVGMAETAAQTGDSALKFGNQLQGLSQALQGGNPEGLTPHMEEVLQGTSRMRLSAEALQAQVTASRQEIERLHTELERVRDEALLCPLTRILNRKGFDKKLAEMLAQPPATGARHCLVMIDIDHFKKVNDTHGHVTGDRVIQALGEVLRQTVTQSGHSTARYGGEEFAILLPHTQPDAAMKLAEQMRLRVKGMKIRNKKTQEELLNVTISLGLAAMTEADDATSLVSRADQALYQSKQAGRDRLTQALPA